MPAIHTCACVCVFEALPTSPLTSLTVPPFGERRGHFWQLSIVVVVCVHVRAWCVREREREREGGGGGGRERERETERVCVRVCVHT